MKQIEVYFDTDYKLTKNGHRVYTKTIENRNIRQQKEYMEKMHGGHEVVPEYFMMKLMNEHNNVKPNGHRWFEYTYWVVPIRDLFTYVSDFQNKYSYETIHFEC